MLVRRLAAIAGVAMSATLILVAATVPLETSPVGASGSSRALDQSTPTSDGVWPGVGKICEPGSGGASSVRGVGPKSINIAAFNDATNTVQPGLEIELLQAAKAFAAWCNASGGIDGRHIVVDDRDAALFNAAQVTQEACRSDFMAVGGGMALDAPAVPVREQCGLGQITGYTVSDAADAATFQVNPGNINSKIFGGGWFGVLAQKYPQAVRKAAMGGANSPSILEPEHKYEDAATALGWKVLTFQEPSLSVTDWTPYVQQVQSQGVEALWPSDSSNIAPYFQAMNTAGYKPAFVALGGQLYASSTIKALAGLTLPPVYAETTWWPLEIASENPSTEQLVRIMHTYAKGDAIDSDDEQATEAWLLWAKSASACGSTLTVSCVLTQAATAKNWSAGGMQAPVARVTASDQNPIPSPCFVLMRATPAGFVYDKAITRPTQSIWNCDPKNNVHLTPSELASL